MRRVLFVSALALIALPAYADRKADHKKTDKVDKVEPPPPAPKPPRPPGPDDAKVTALLDKIAADPAARPAAITELGTLAPHELGAIGDYLARKHAFAIEDRKKPLVAIKASVPDKSGRFIASNAAPKEAAVEDAFDWLAELGKLDAQKPENAAIGEVIADDVAIRALAAAKDPAASVIIFEAAFADETMLYRDECGRYLRKAEPYSIPELTKESWGDGDRRRYATFQLERLDRQEPGKALAAAAGDESLTIAILDTFREVHHREAVHAVWGLVNADSPRVRAAARAAWMAYVTGPPPPPAPKKKLQLPGGKLTKLPKPLWLTYRELADNELRKAANELLHEDYPIDDPSTDDYEKKSKTVKVDLEDLTKRLFAFYDEARTKAELASWTEAKAKADTGDLATATQMLDRMLVANPDHGQKAAMASIYFAWGNQLERKQLWADAAAAYSKAQGLDPTGPSAKDALASHYLTLGKSLEAQGKDGSPDYRRAIALKPDFAQARTAEAESPSGKAVRPLWMLFAAGSAALLALLLFGIGMVKRRA